MPRLYFATEGGALANIDHPLVSLFFQNTKPDWHETGRAQKEINHRCCLTRIGEANQAVFISTAGGLEQQFLRYLLLGLHFALSCVFFAGRPHGFFYHFLVILNVSALAK